MDSFFRALVATGLLGVLTGCQSTPKPTAPDASHLEQMAGTTPNYFERIGDVVSPTLKNDIVIAGNKPIAFVGWAVDGSSNSVASGVHVVIDGKDYHARYGIPRPDVAQALKNPALTNSGYSLDLPAGSLPPGQHQVESRIITADGKKYFEIGPVQFKVE